LRFLRCKDLREQRATLGGAKAEGELAACYAGGSQGAKDSRIDDPAEVHAVAASHRRFSVAKDVPSETNSRAKVVFI